MSNSFTCDPIYYAPNKMKHGSLFSGIGGFDLAAEWIGWENVFHCEREPFAQKVLQHHFPNSKLYEDIKKFDATNYFGRIDILTGGFPCQPFSAAGKRKGTEDDRHLWPEMLRIIREISPRYVVGENVRGLVNWSGGLVFEQVCADLEAEGYEVIPFILPACAKDAPHRRDRIWFVAYANGAKSPNDKRENARKTEEIRGKEKGDVSGQLSCNGIVTDTTGVGSSRKRFGKIKQRRKISNKRIGANIQHELNDNGKVWNATDTENNRHRRGYSKGRKERVNGILPRKSERGTLGSETEGRSRKRNADQWQTFPTQSPLCRRNDGLSKRLDDITFPKWRKESIKAYGNAIVPQVVFEIFKAIQIMEDEIDKEEEEFLILAQAH